jgi:hypothetical protein
MEFHVTLIGHAASGKTVFRSNLEDNHLAAGRAGIGDLTTTVDCQTDLGSAKAVIRESNTGPTGQEDGVIIMIGSRSAWAQDQYYISKNTPILVIVNDYGQYPGAEAAETSRTAEFLYCYHPGPLIHTLNVNSDDVMTPLLKLIGLIQQLRRPSLP